MSDQPYNPNALVAVERALSASRGYRAAVIEQLGVDPANHIERGMVANYVRSVAAIQASGQMVQVTTAIRTGYAQDALLRMDQLANVARALGAQHADDEFGQFYRAAALDTLRDTYSSFKRTGEALTEHLLDIADEDIRRNIPPEPRPVPEYELRPARLFEGGQQKYVKVRVGSEENW